MKKSRAMIRIVLIFVAILMPIAAVNIKIARGAKLREETYSTVTYSSDASNNIRDSIISARLVTERFEASGIIQGDDYISVLFDDVWFGTLEIEFDTPLDHELHLTVTFSEKLEGDRAWTREDANSNLVGYGVSFRTVDAAIPMNTEKYKIELGERPLPIPSIIEGGEDGWNGGVIPFYCCTIKGIPNDIVNSCRFYQVAVHTPFLLSSQFRSSNADLDEIYDYCKHTVEATTYAGIYVDGYRELKPYEGDAYVNELSHFSVDNNYELAKTTLLYFSENHTWPTEWILQTVSLAYEYYMYTGDIELISEIYPNLRKCLLQSQIDENGLLDMSTLSPKTKEDFEEINVHNIIDWPESERDGFPYELHLDNRDKMKSLENKYRSFVAEAAGFPYAATYYKIVSHDYHYRNAKITDPNAVVNAFYYNALNEMIILASAVGEQEDYESFCIEAEHYKDIYSRIFISSDTGLVTDTVECGNSSLHSNVVALDYGLVPEEHQQTVIDFIKSKGMSCSPYFSQYLLETMVKYGETEYAIDLITSRSERSWYHMIDTGSKLTTEAWNEDLKLDMDWNHAWATAPVNIITRHVVGVQPYVPGCETLLFSPHTADLTDIVARVPVKTGCVEVAFNRNDHVVQIDIEVPVNTLFKLPVTADSLIVDGKAYDVEETWIEAGHHNISYYLSY